MKIPVALCLFPLVFAACHKSSPPTAIEAEPVGNPPVAAVRAGATPAGSAGEWASPASAPAPATAPVPASASAPAAVAAGAKGGAPRTVSEWYERLDDPDPQVQIRALGRLVKADAETVQALRERLRSYAYNQDAAAPLVALAVSALRVVGDAPPANAGPALLQCFATEADPQLAAAETEALIALAREDSDTRQGAIAQLAAAPAGPLREKLTAILLKLGSKALPDLHTQLDKLPADSAQRAPVQAVIDQLERR